MCTQPYTEGVELGIYRNWLVTSVSYISKDFTFTTSVIRHKQQSYKYAQQQNSFSHPQQSCILAIDLLAFHLRLMLDSQYQVEDDRCALLV